MATRKLLCCKRPSSGEQGNEDTDEYTATLLDVNTIKCVMVGDGASGKSYAAIKYSSGEMPTFYTPTIQATYTKDVNIDDKVVQLQIWDTAGQLTYDHTRPLSYTGADIVMIAFNLASANSLDNVKNKWFPEIKNHLEGVPIVLVGMQSDKVHSQDKKDICSEQWISRIIEIVEPVGYYKCSTMLDRGINEVFENVTRLGIKAHYSTLDKINVFDINRENDFVLDFNNCKSDDEAAERLIFWKDKILMGISAIEHDVYDPLDSFCFSAGKTLLHSLLERKYFNSTNYFLSTHEDKTIKMLTIVDATGRIPEFYARDNGLSEIAEKIKQITTKHNVDLSNLKDARGECREITTVDIFQYAEKGSDHSLKELAYKAYLEDKIEEFFSKQNPGTSDSLLMAIDSDELANDLLNSKVSALDFKTRVSIIRISNSNNENIFHVFARKGFIKSINTLMEKIAKSDDDSYDGFGIPNLLFQVDLEGNTPVMSAAIREQGETLARLLLFYYGKSQRDVLNEMLHCRNNNGLSILSIVQRAKEMMYGPYGILLELEKFAHLQSKDDRKGFLELQRCLREKSGSSQKTVKTLNMLRETTPMSRTDKAFACIKIVVGLFFFRLAMYLFDVITDSFMSKVYYNEWRSPVLINRCNESSRSLNDYPVCLESKPKFLYSAIFIAAPWAFYAYEFFMHDIPNAIKLQVRKIVKAPFSCLLQSQYVCLRNITKRMCSIITYFILCLVFPICFILWPVLTLLHNVIYLIKDVTSDAESRNKLDEKLRKSSLASGRAQLLEVCIEATFQIVLQWYLLYPSFINGLTKRDFTYYHSNESDHSIIPYLSMLSSIISLAWSFTAHKARYKDGALDLTVSPISRVVLFFSDLLFILSRINFLVLFMYFFGPGQFYPGIIFLVSHSVIMMFFHVYFREKKISHQDDEHQDYQTRSCCDVVKKRMMKIHEVLLNGLANMFSNNGYLIISEEKQMTKKRTFKHHLMYDLVFLTENAVLAGFGYMVDLKDDDQIDAKIYTIIASSAFHVLGLLLKAIYYAKLHVWSDLILDI